MTTEKRTKINKLINNWPNGTVMVSKYLTKMGYKQDLYKFYQIHNWIKTIGFGAFKKSNDNIEWYGAIYAFQKQLQLTIHPGGKTALELGGYSHYLQSSMINLFLFGFRGEKLPQWHLNYNWNVNTKYSANSLFLDNVGLKSYRYRDFEIMISSPERAILEMLYHFPKYHTFDECYHIMENLAGLQPALCQTLLEQCNSVKVKRMFLFLAEYIDHFWLDGINLSKINLGKGKRVLVQNGSYVKKYKITVPKVFKV